MASPIRRSGFIEIESARSQQAQLRGFLGAGGNFGVADQLEDFARILEPQQQLLAAAAAGNQTHAHFHQPHVGFGRRLRARAMQHDLAAAAQRRAERRRDHGLGRVLQRHVDLLEAMDGAVQLVPFALLRGQQHQHQVGADAEVLAFVGDHHGFEVACSVSSRPACIMRDVVFAERVHLAVELDAQHAVAQIDQRCAGVLLAPRRARA